MNISNPAHPLNPINPANPMHHELYDDNSHHYHAETHQHIHMPSAKRCVGDGLGLVVIFVVIIGIFKIW